MTRTVCGPATKFTVTLNLRSLPTVAGLPFTVTLVTDLSTRPETVTGAFV